MRTLIYGWGQLAASAIQDLSAQDVEITVLGRQRSRLERLSAYSGVTATLIAEPAMQDYLLESGISHADAFLALSDDDHENLLLAQIAKHMFNVPKVVCHVENPELQFMYTKMGLNVVGSSIGILQDIRQVLGF